jgi:hypothetical protein
MRWFNGFRPRMQFFEIRGKKTVNEVVLKGQQGEI